jgi:hypothetical protein
LEEVGEGGGGCLWVMEWVEAKIIIEIEIDRRTDK